MTIETQTELGILVFHGFKKKTKNYNVAKNAK